MCGLFGWTIRPDSIEKFDLHALAVILAINMERRGNESWGVAMQDKPDEVPSILKNTGSIKKTCKIRQILAPQVIGHTRKATVGAITVPNAHPFRIGGTIGAHNGHVQDHFELNKRLKRNFEVDSQHLIAHIDQNLPLTDISGSGTVVYQKLSEPGKIFFGRGQFSDLAIFGIGPKKAPWGTVWGSTKYGVEEALEMAGVDDFEVWDTIVNQRYVLINNDLIEDGAFPFRNNYSHYTPPVGQHNRSAAAAACRKFIDGAGQRDHLWNQSENIEEYWKRCDAERENALVPITDPNQLPKSLKKSQEIRVLGQGEDQKAVEATRRCDACAHVGDAATDYSSHADGVVFSTEASQYLCYQCYCFWGTATQRETGVPELSLNMEY